MITAVKVTVKDSRLSSGYFTHSVAFENWAEFNAARKRFNSNSVGPRIVGYTTVITPQVYEQN